MILGERSSPTLQLVRVASRRIRLGEAKKRQRVSNSKAMTFTTLLSLKCFHWNSGFIKNKYALQSNTCASDPVYHRSDWGNERINKVLRKRMIKKKEGEVALKAFSLYRMLVEIGSLL